MELKSVLADRPVWAEVNLGNIVHNYNEVQRKVGKGVQLMPIIKANAYGHGILAVAGALGKIGAGYFGVAILNEAIQLREAGSLNNILVLGWTPQEDYERAIENDITLTVFTFGEAKLLSSIAKQKKHKAKIHIKIDTGMKRLGIEPNASNLRIVERILELPGLNVEGIYTHFAKADEYNSSVTKEQIEKFINFYERIENKTGYTFKYKHAANSAGIINYPDSYLDLVRPGLVLYGLSPSNKKENQLELRPALSLKAKIAYVKKVEKGTPISYGGKYIAGRETIIATLPIGYADGYSRLLSNKAEMIFKGKRVKTVGMICMDQLMIDVTNCGLGIKQGNVVTLLGHDGGECIYAEEIADTIGTINYEIISMISNRIPRVYID